MKKIIKKILLQLSRTIYFIWRFIFYIIPKEFQKNSELEIKIKKHLTEDIFNHFKENFKKSVLLRDEFKIREYAITTSLLNDKNKSYYYLEFGTWKGESANFFSKYLNKLYVFDSFEGLMEDWAGTGSAKSDFNLNKKIPKLNSNVEVIAGWIEDTLETFLKNNNPKINFVHFDMDTYSPTKFALEILKPYLAKEAIIIFDQLYNYIGWEEGEYKALKEVFKENEFKYKAFCLNSSQVVIQLK
jgi:hypothetical protein